MATDSDFLAGILGGCETVFVKVDHVFNCSDKFNNKDDEELAEVNYMAIEPKDYRLMVRIPDDIRSILQSIADKEKTSVAEITRRAISYYFDEGDGIDQYRARIKNLQEQNDGILGTFTSLLNQGEIDRSNFNICVIALMDVLGGNVSDDDKQQLAAKFAPYAELAQRQQEEAKRQYEERQKMTSEAVASAQRKKAEAALNEATSE